MKNLLSWKFAAAALTLVLVWAVPAGAQTPAIRVDVPFAFTVGGHALPAGEYRFTVETTHMLTVITPLNGGELRMVRLQPGASDRNAANLEKGVLRFEKFGDRYVLDGIWTAGSTRGNTIAGRRPPKELAHSEAVRDVVTR